MLVTYKNFEEVYQHPQPDQDMIDLVVNIGVPYDIRGYKSGYILQSHRPNNEPMLGDIIATTYEEMFGSTNPNVYVLDEHVVDVRERRKFRVSSFMGGRSTLFYEMVDLADGIKIVVARPIMSRCKWELVGKYPVTH